jgi:ABC-type Fe3+/spermidine/putrescine transport system ATPase subunit
MVSHDPLDVLSWADKILVLKDGRIIQEGNPHQIYYQPVNEYCAGLFGDYNLINVNTSSLPASISSNNLNGKLLLIRPEQINLTESKENSICGNVKNILFWGSYYTVDVIAGKQTLRVKTCGTQLKEGDSVNLLINGDTWFI